MKEIWRRASSSGSQPVSNPAWMMLPFSARIIADTSIERPQVSPEFRTGARELVVAATKVSGLMLRAMIQAARADGEIDPDERKVLMEIMGDSTPEERDFIEAQMAAPVDPEALARDTPRGHEIEVYTAAVLAIEPDNHAEAVFLDNLAEGLKIGQTEVNGIHEAHGKPPLYTL